MTKEQAILEAAEQEFLDNGFEAAKTTRICKLAGVTHAMLHYYYRTKENLFEKIFEKKINLLKDSLFVFMDKSDMPFLEKVQRSIELHFDFLRANANLPRFVINELIFKPKRLDLFKEKIHIIGTNVLSRISQEIEREVKQGTINPIESVDLLLNIASVNVFVFATMPLLRAFAVEVYGNENAFFEARKRENVEIILRRLKRIDN